LPSSGEKYKFSSSASSSPELQSKTYIINNRNVVCVVLLPIKFNGLREELGLCVVIEII